MPAIRSMACANQKKTPTETAEKNEDEKGTYLDFDIFPFLFTNTNATKPDDSQKRSDPPT